MSEQSPRDLPSYVRALDVGPDQAELPPHWPTCLGCGPANDSGFHMQVRRDGDDVVAEHVFEERHSGAPGIAHGGAVATVVDDVLGFLLYVARLAGVTRQLEVEYLRPVRLGVPYHVRAHVDSRDGRKLWVSCTGSGPDGTLIFTGRALFLQVPLAHFTEASPGAEDPVAP
ncbi:MAG: PaaI family thioesterase [Mycobacteriales bacterium]